MRNVPTVNRALRRRCAVTLILLLTMVGSRAPAAPSDAPDPLPSVEALDPQQYLRTVSWAKEAMRLLLSPMDEQQEQQFDAEWAPAFRFPCLHLVNYLNELVPLLERYVALRTQMMAAAEGFDAAWLEANLMTELKDPAGVLEALGVAWEFKQQFLAMQKPLEETTEKIGEMGPPPDPNACRSRRRNFHDASVHAMEQQAAPPGPRWVLTSKELITVEEPFAETITSPHGGNGLTNAWRWRCALKGTSLECEHAYGWKHAWRVIVDSNPNPPFEHIYESRTASGESVNAVRIVWSPLPEIVPAMVNEKGVLYTEVEVPLRITDLRRANGQPIRTGETNDMYADNGERQVGIGWDAQLYSPNGQTVYGNLAFGFLGFSDAGGYDKYAVDYLGDVTSRQTVGKIGFRYNAAQWPEHYELVNGEKMNLPADAEPGQGWTTVVRIYLWSELWGDLDVPMPQVVRRDKYSEGRRNIALVAAQYTYTFDPNHELDPISLADETNMWDQTADSTGAPASEEDIKRAQEEAEARAAQIDFHQNAIDICKANIAHWRDQLSRTTDTKARKQILMSLMHAQHTMQSEQDRIRELQTGEIVHTRTAVDEWYHQRFVDQVTRRMDTGTRIMKLREGTRRMIRLAPRDQQEQLQAFVARHQGDIETWGDVDNAQKIAGIVFDRVQGHWEHEYGIAIDEMYAAEYNLRLAQTIKMTADAEMFVMTMGASGSWTAANLAMPCYMGGTEFIQTEGTTEHRLYQAVKTGLRWSNAAGQVISDAMEGYEKGGWLNGERGWWGALEKGSESLLLTAGTHFAVGKLFRQPPGPNPPTVDDAFEYARHKIRMEEAQVMVGDYEQAYREYQRVLEFGGSADEIARLEQLLQQKAAGLHASYEAKLVLKQMQDPTRYVDVIADYNVRMAQVHRQVEERFRQMMGERGFDDVSQWYLKEFRNASNIGSVGMDYDIGLMRRELVANKRQIIEMDIPLLDEQVRLLDTADDAVQFTIEIPYTRGGIRVTPHHMQREAQQVWNHAYSGVTGYGAGRSFETLTTYIHPEAYTDLAWLGGNGVKGVNIGQLVSAKAGQAGDVTLFKVAHMANDPAWTRMQVAIEASRGMAKDIDTKLLPLLEAAGNQSGRNATRFRQYHNHWNQLSQALAGAADDPIRANEQVRMITGGKDINQIALDLRDMLASYGQALGN